EIKKSVNIAGPGAGLLAVSGNDAHRVFDVREGVTARIAGLTVTHGRVVGNNGGGAVLNSGGSLALADDVFSDNVAVGNFSFGNIDTLPVGGAVRNRNNATLTVTNCAFVGNKALGEEGGGNAWGGGLSNDSGSAATVTGCAFTANVAAGGDGGRSTSGQLIVGHGEGGGIANFAACTVRNCTFTANLAAGGSGCAGDAQNA